MAIQKLISLGGKPAIIIPAWMLKKLHITMDTELDVRVEGQHIVIRPISKADPSECK